MDATAEALTLFASSMVLGCGRDSVPMAIEHGGKLVVDRRVHRYL